MLTINNILKEIKNVPVNRLNEVYQFVHSLTTETHIKEKKKQKILSYAGLFSDMNKKEYSDFLHQIKKNRKTLFTRC